MSSLMVFVIAFGLGCITGTVVHVVSHGRMIRGIVEYSRANLDLTKLHANLPVTAQSSQFARVDVHDGAMQTDHRAIKVALAAFPDAELPDSDRDYRRDPEAPATPAHRS